MNASRKRFKAALALEIRKFGPLSLLLKLGEFSLFDKFFLDLANFRDLNNFWPFDFPDFLAISIPPTLSLPLPSSTSSLSKFQLFGGIDVFSIKVSRATILLKP